MKATAYLKLSGSLIALTAAAVSQADAQTTATGWTGGSSFHTNAPTAGGAGGGTPIIGDNLWHNPLNWGGGTPNAGVDVSIGLATRDQYYVRYSCNGPGPAPDLDWCENIYDSLRPGSGWDQVMLTGQAGNARNLYIGLAGDRGLKYNSGGPGHLTNESSLTVIQNMVVGQTGVGTYIATGTTTVGGNVVIGGEGNGTVTNTNRMDVGGNLTVGANAKGTLNNTDIVEVKGDITVGQSAQGVFANTGGTVTAEGNFIVGFEAEGEFTNSGTVTVGRNFTVGESGQGTVNNNDAGTIAVTGNTAIGENAAGIGAITLRNTSSLTTGGTMMVGEHGKGTLVIGTEARAETTGRVTLGTSVSGIGIVSNSGTMINHDKMVVGAMGQGRLLTSSNATTITTGDVVVGETATGKGFVAVRGGTMDNAGRLDIGDQGEGYMIVHDGARVTDRESVVGRQRGGKGYVLVSDATSIWDSQYSLTLGGEAESIGILTINNDGEVQIRQGYGTLTIAEKAGSTGILNIGGAYPPTGLGFPIAADVAAYVSSNSLNQDVNSPAPLAAGTLDAAFVQFGAGTGTVNFNHTETEAQDYRFKAGFIGYGQINHYGNFTVLDGDSSAFTGNAHVLNGTLVINNIFAGSATVDLNGILRIGDRNGLTGEVRNNIVNNGIVQFNRADTSRYAGVISGIGAVEQIGTGTTVLTGENTYTGQTRIQNGTLQLGDGGTTGSIDHTSVVMIDAAGTLAFNRSDIKVFDRTITGTGQIAQIGTGLTRLTADNSGFTGRTRIDAGTLSVNGRLGGTVDVNDTGTLEGLGQVGTTTVRKGGTIAPGNSTDPNMQRIGTLTIAGNLVQEAGSFYKTDVLSTGQSDLIHVTGTAAISNDAVLHVTKVDPARYELEQRYTVLTADGGVTGDYILAGDTFVSTFYRLEDHYDANNVYLDVAQYRLFPEAGRTRNQIAAATGAQELKAARDAYGRPTNPLFRAIAYLPTDEEARYAFDQISGEIYASVQGAMLEESRMVRDVMGDRIRRAFGDNEEKIVGYIPGIDIKDPTPQPVYGNDQEGPVIWARGFGNWGAIDGDGNAARLERDGRGLFVGADMPFLDVFRIGLLAGYDRTDYDVAERNSSAASNNYHIGVYGGAEWWKLALQLGAAYTWHKAEVSRQIVFPGFAESASSEFDAGTAQIYGDLNYTFHPAGLPSLRLQPFLGLAYVNNKQGSYDEVGGYAALYGGADQSLGLGYGTLGLRAAREFEIYEMQLTLHGMAAWRRAFSDVEPSATHRFDGSSMFTVFGTPQAVDAGILEIGLDANLSEHWGIGMSYAGQYTNDVKFHNLRGDLNYRW